MTPTAAATAALEAFTPALRSAELHQERGRLSRPVPGVAVRTAGTAFSTDSVAGPQALPAGEAGQGPAPARPAVQAGEVW